MGKNSVTGGQPIGTATRDMIGSVVSNASGGGVVMNGVIVDVDPNGRNAEVVSALGRNWYEATKLLILADNVTDHVAKSLDRVREAHRQQLRGLAKDLNILGREKNAEDEIRTVLTDNGVQPASELYRIRMTLDVFVDVRPLGINAFDKVSAVDQLDLDWLTNSIRASTEEVSGGEGGNIYVEPDSDFSFDALHINTKQVTGVVEFGE